MTHVANRGTSDFEVPTEFLSIGRIRWCLLLLRVNVFGSGDSKSRVYPTRVLDCYGIRYRPPVVIPAFVFMQIYTAEPYSNRYVIV
jgi:hypothetical protein